MCQREIHDADENAAIDREFDVEGVLGKIQPLANAESDLRPVRVPNLDTLAAYASKLLPGPEKRSQDLPRVFGPTGAIWIARTESLLSAGTFYGPDHRFFEIDWKHAIDIDDPDDLELAAAILSEQREKRSSD